MVNTIMDRIKKSYKDILNDDIVKLKSKLQPYHIFYLFGILSDFAKKYLKT